MNHNGSLRLSHGCRPGRLLGSAKLKLCVCVPTICTLHSPSLCYHEDSWYGTISYIYIEFWYRKDQGDFSKKKHLHLFNGKTKLGFRGHFGPALATGPLFRPMLPASNVELVSKHALSKKIALGLLAHISTRCCPVSQNGLNPKSSDSGFKTKNWIFLSEDKGFCPFYAYSDSGDSFGLQSWGSDWGEAWTQSLQIFDPRYFCNTWLDPQTNKKINLLCTQS